MARKKNVYSLQRGIKKAQEESEFTKNEKFREFFEVLDEAVTVFKSGHKMPKANAGDSRVSVRVEKGKPKIRFEFLAKGDNHVEIVIDAQDLAANPKEYIENMLECLNEGMKQMKEESRIIIPVSVSQNHLRAVQ